MDTITIKVVEVKGKPVGLVLENDQVALTVTTKTDTAVSLNGTTVEMKIKPAVEVDTRVSRRPEGA